MPLDPGLAGRTFAPTEPYTVSREKIAEFSQAVGAAPVDGGATAPPTFPIVVAFAAMRQLMDDPEVGIQLHHVVHGEQRFEQSRLVRAGDELTGTLTVDTVRGAAGMDILATRTEVRSTSGELVSTAYATLVHRGGA